MAKLTRVTGKVFGATASTTNTPVEIGQFGSAKAGTYNATNDVATIQNLSAWSNGWIDAVTPTDQFPPLPEMTGVHKVLSYQEAYLLQQGIPEWDSATDYYINSFCSLNGKIYVSLSDNNINNNPAIDDTKWFLYNAIDDYANQNINNLTAFGNARLQYAPFAINAGTVDEGKNVTLQTPGGTPSPVTKSLIPVLSSNVSEYGTASMTGAYSGQAYQITSQGVNALPASNIVWLFTFNSDYYMPANRVASFTITSTNALDSARNPYGINGCKITFIYTDDTEEVVFNNSSMFTNNWSGIPITAGGACSASSKIVKAIRLEPYKAYYTACTNFTMTFVDYISTSSTLITSPCTITTADGRTTIDELSVTYDTSSTADGDYYIFKDYNDGSLSLVSSFVISKIEPTTPSDGDYWLDSSTIPANLKYYDTSDWITNNNLVYIGYCTVSSGVITSLTNKLFNDNGYSQGTATEAGFAMPSDTYINLTFGADQATYTAPANGWFSFYGSTSAVNNGINLTNLTNYMTSGAQGPVANFNLTANLVVKKGDQIELDYWNGTPNVTRFRFIYAKGSESEAQ